MKRRARALSVSFLLIVIDVGACGGTSDDQPPPRSSLPTSPVSPPAQPRTTSSIRIYGIVFDHTSERVVPRANVPVFVHSTGSDTVFAAMSDSAGRYSVSEVRSDREFDLHVVAATLLSTAGAPANMPAISSIWVSGGVFESTADGKRPVAGATVSLGRASFSPHAGSTTLTDSAGRYLVCPSIPSHGTDQYAEVVAERNGYVPASLMAFLGWDYSGIDIQLVRK